MSNEVVYETHEVIKRPLETVKEEIISLTRQAQVNAVHYACEIGKRLCEAKEQVGHGAWGEWLKTEVDYSQSTAENFMKIYREYGSNQMSLFSDFSNSQTFGKLDVSKLLLLASVPAEERENVAKEVDAENISVRELKEKLKERDTELEIEKSRAEEAEEDIKKLETEISRKDSKIEELQISLKELEKDIEDIPENTELAEVQKEELEKQKKEYEDKLEKLQDSKNKSIEKLKASEEKLKTELAKANAEKDAAIRRADELQKADKKAELSANSDLVLINEYLKRLQREADTVITALEGFKGSEMYEKLKGGITAILQGLIEKVN